MDSIENSICDAIEYYLNNAISQAGYNRTIKATIKSCEDSATGKYKCKYQDSSFYAYSTNTDITYSNNTEVYILVPNNDISATKTILGTVEKLGSDYTTVEEADSAYEYVGNDCITQLNDLSFASKHEYNYPIDNKTEYLEVLYDADNLSSSQLIINDTAFAQYISESDNLIIGASFATDFDKAQKQSGTYGLVFGIDFVNASNSEKTITKYYLLSSNNMTGDPFNFSTFQRQIGIYPVEGANFKRISSVAFFAQDFPIQNKTTKEVTDGILYDIFINNIELWGANRLSDQELSSYGVSIITTKGTICDESLVKLPLTAQFRKAGIVTDDNVEYYWFKENPTVGTSNLIKYNSYGGCGWECLNSYSVITDQGDDSEYIKWDSEDSIELANAKLSQIANNRIIYAEKTVIRCIAVYKDLLYSKDVTITNEASKYNITIESTGGTKFFFDTGNPILTCKINNESNPTYYNTEDKKNHYYKYFWSRKDLNDNLVTLPNSNIESTIENNILKDINVGQIDGLVSFKCTVYLDDATEDYDGTFIGATSISLSNSYEVTNNYVLDIENGTQLFKYNEAGVSPCSDSLAHPQTIKNLRLVLYDVNNEEVDLSNAIITWTIPSQDESLLIVETENPKETLTFNIQNNFNYDKSNNKLVATVISQGVTYSAHTNFTFTKEGDAGTNGTDYTCRIVPNVAASADMPVYAAYNLTDGTFNFKKAGKAHFKVQLFKLGEEIFEGSISGASLDTHTDVTVKWSFLQNKYTSKESDISNFIINENTGEITFNEQSIYDSSIRSCANILKCTVTYDDKYIISAVYPIITRTTDKIMLKDYTGFRNVLYSSDGLNPVYDSTYPFEITGATNCNWSCLGQIYDYKKKYIINTTCFTEHSKMGIAYVKSHDPINNNSVSVNYLLYDDNGNEYYAILYNTDEWDKGTPVYITIPANIKSDTRIIIRGRVSDLGEDYLERYDKTYNLKDNQCIFIPNSSYDGVCVTAAISCSSNEGTIYIPIYLSLNTYGMAALNGWDGNTVQVNKEGGYILAPQVGAGKKNSSNQFTGVVMGEIQEANATESETGLFGYGAGTRTFSLDAETGSLTLGASGSGQLSIIPGVNGTDATIAGWKINESSFTNNQVGIQASSNKNDYAFWAGNSTPSLANFSVTHNGDTIMKTAIIGNANTTSSDKITVDHNITNGYQTHYYVIDNETGVTVNEHYINSTKAFDLLQHERELPYGYHIKLDYSDSYKIDSNTYPAIYSGSKSSLTEDVNGFYIGTNGFALGTTTDYGETADDGEPIYHSKFEVSSAGKLYAKDAIIKGDITADSGYIGNWTIKNRKLQYGDSSDPTIELSPTKFKMGDYFEVTSSGNGIFKGNITADSGFIGNWKIEEGALKAIETDEDGNDKTTIKLSTNRIQILDILDISKSSASFTGTIYAKKGSIGSWYIDDNGYLYSDNITISPTSIRLGNLRLFDTGNVTGGSFSGGSIYLDGDGNDLGSAIYLQKDNINYGWLSFDETDNVAYAANATKRIYLRTAKGAALKLQADASISLQSGSGGNGIWFASPLCLSNSDSENLLFGTEEEMNNYTPKNQNQLFFVV